MPKNQSTLFRLEEAQKSLDLDTGFILELVEDFIESGESFLSPLRRALEDEDYAELLERSHRLKGTAANLRVNAISAKTLELEQAAKQEEEESCRSRLLELERLFSALEEEFRLDHRDGSGSW
jgi:HPt (histidine-containing phosphotransfer) domain-containing protein